MENSPRYVIEKVGNLDYVIFDMHNKGQLVYVLFVVPIQHRWYNYQVVLSVFNASNRTSADYPQLERELWTNYMYLDDEGLLRICTRILLSLQNYEIEYPVELSYLFGGIVNGRIPVTSDLALCTS